MKAIVTDIEGTTTDINFVHQILFPYAKQHVKEFVAQHRENPEIQKILQDVRTHIEKPYADEKSLLELLLQWMNEDLKITPLKQLQGMMWQQGYERGDFKGHVYQDAFEKLQQWHQQNLKLYIFSSGSVQAQKLIFGYSVFGDLNYLFSGYFDTNIGAKKEAVAYEKITREINLPPADILFLSDVKAELDAAHKAGMQTCWVVRDGDLPESDTHKVVKSFKEI